MMTTKNYEFCDDIWGEIKSYLFVPRTKGDKCDFSICERPWTRQYGVLDYDLWWEGANPRGESACVDGKVRGYNIPCKWGEYPCDISVGEEKKTSVLHSCEHCWVRNLTSWNSDCDGLYNFVNRHFYNVFLNRVGNTEKNEKIVSLILDQKINDDHWLIKKHRLLATRQLQETAKEVLIELLNDYNKITKQQFYKKRTEMMERIESAKVRACQRFWFPLMKEVRDREYIKLFNQGKMNYLELIKKLH